MADTATMTAAEWLAPGRKTVEGYLLALRGPRKRRGTLMEEVLMDVLEERGANLPRYSDLHAVWFGFDPDGPPNNQHRRPFLRYKASRPIPGLNNECSHHRVELTCTVGESWSNGLGAYITRAEGRCLECPSPVVGGPDGGPKDG